jgi:hypothetical protein
METEANNLEKQLYQLSADFRINQENTKLTGNL